MIFKGSGVALITPFDEEGNVNFKKLKELLKFHIKKNTDAVVVCGTSGEAATLSDDELKEIIKFSVENVNKKIPVIAGTGSNNTRHCIELSKYAESVGADGLLIVTPYYNKCTQEGLYLHFKEIANSVTLPIIIYNVPTRTCVNIEPETVVRLSKISNVVGIKEASGNISQIAKLLSIAPKEFAVYSGNDDETLPIMSLGGAGVISVIANIYPKEMHDLCKYFFEGNIEKSRKIQFKYLDLMKKLFIEVNPMPIKESMNILGKKVGECRLPLCKMSNSNIEILKKSLKEL